MKSKFILPRKSNIPLRAQFVYLLIVGFFGALVVRALERLTWNIPVELNPLTYIFVYFWGITFIILESLGIEDSNMNIIHMILIWIWLWAAMSLSLIIAYRMANLIIHLVKR